MKTARKVLLLALCAVMLVTATITGTLAYLTSTDTVTNTFTVGNVKITMDEAKVDSNGKDIVEEGENAVDERVKANEYKLLPGHDYDKDPTIHVDAKSEDCWVFVKIVNEIAAIEDAKTVATQMTENKWAPIAEGSDIYAYETTVSGGADVPVFASFKIKGDVDNTTLAAYEGKTIVVTAYAIQADGFDTAAEAWTAGGAQALAKENATT